MTQISIVNSVTPDFIAQLNENFAQIDAALDGLLAVSSFSGGSTGLTPSSDSQGVIVLGGHLNAAHGGVDFDASGNTRAGDGALTGLTTGQFNTAFGKDALAAMTTDTYSDAFGYGALIKATGHANAAFGAGAGGTVTTAFDGVYIGADAGRNADNSGDMTGDNNVLVGVHAGGHITSGRFNNFIGNYSGVGGGYYIGHPAALLTGGYNVGLGHITLGNIQGDANENVAVGYSAGSGIVDGVCNIFLGPYAGRDTTTGAFNILIGRDVQATSVTADDELNIGNLLRGSGLSQGGAPSTGSIGVGVPLSRYPANTLEVYNNTQAGLRLNTDAGGGLYFTDINQQTDGILNIITPAAGYAKFSGDVVVGGGVTTGPKTFPATFKSQTAGGAVLQYAAAASGPNFATVTLASHGTVASPTAVAVSDLLATPIRVQGYDGGAYRSAAQLSVGVAAAVSSGIVPGYWLFETANASGVMTSALSIDHQQNIKVASGKQLWLGNAYQAGAPTATGYLLVTDSAGTVYEIPAKLH